MDQYLSTIIVAVITGIFSVITLVIQKKQDKVIEKIDKQTISIEREKKLEAQLHEKQSERTNLVHEMMILILKSNIALLREYNELNSLNPDNDMYSKADSMIAKFDVLSEEIAEISKEYRIVLEMTSEFQRNLDQQAAGNK